MRRKLEALDPALFGALMSTLATEVPLDDRLHEIRCPTLVVVGDADRNFRKPSEVLANGIPDAKLVVLADAHHSPQIEAREAWLETILAHLERARA